MQYGNENHKGEVVGDADSLNRTMQYGNKVNLIPLCSGNVQFKSYYVVWKRDNVEVRGWFQGRFKSYYVVWKPLEKEDEEEKYYGFKSYYVVWKPYTIYLIFFVFFLFKSYYVVWKHKMLGFFGKSVDEV